jgi:hypothetical protein
LHDSRYVIYWPYSTPENLVKLKEATAKREAEKLALDSITIDQVAPGEQQPESDHFFKAEGADTGLNKGMRWRHATKWVSYELSDKKFEAKILRLSFSTADAGRQFDLLVNGKLVEQITLTANAPQEIYSRDFTIPQPVIKNSKGKLTVKFVARNNSIAGGLYGLRLLR